ARNHLITPATVPRIWPWFWVCTARLWPEPPRRSPLAARLEKPPRPRAQVIFTKENGGRVSRRFLFSVTDAQRPRAVVPGAAIGTLEAMRAEEVALALHQIGGAARLAHRVEIGQSRREGRH